MKIKVEGVEGVEGEGWDLLVSRSAEAVAVRAVALVEAIDITGSKRDRFQRLVDGCNESPGCGAIVCEINDVDSVSGVI